MCAYFFKVNRLPVAVSQPVSELKAKVINEMVVNLIHKGQTQSSDIFLLGNNMHMAVIADCIKAAKERKEDVIATDKEATIFFTLAVGAHIFMPFAWIISPLSFMYVGYLIHERIPAYQEHHQALRELRNCAKWVLGQDATPAKMKDSIIQEMLTVLQDAMTLEQLDKVIINGKTENEFFLNKMIADGTVELKGTTRDELYATFFDSNSHTRTPEGQEMYEKSNTQQKNSIGYRIYGLDQDGSLTQISQRILGYIKHLAGEAFSYAVNFANSPKA